tara:strand:+ start:80 stop:718 length:639 start_codon:yes stop_codon:yes gene_type:complete
MTWAEGLRYVSAERSAAKMEEEALTKAHPPFPPRPVEPFDARMSDNSAAFQEFLSADANQAQGAEGSNEGVAVVAGSRRPSADALTRRSSMTFTEWLEASKEFDLNDVLTRRERMDFYRRMQPSDCRVRREIASDPLQSVVLCLLISGLVGVVLGASITSPIRRHGFRGGRHARTVASPPSSFSSAPPHRHGHESASRAQRGNIQRFMSFLT